MGPDVPPQVSRVKEKNLVTNCSLCWAAVWKTLKAWTLLNFCRSSHAVLKQVVTVCVLTQLLSLWILKFEYCEDRLWKILYYFVLPSCDRGDGMSISAPCDQWWWIPLSLTWQDNLSGHLRSHLNCLVITSPTYYLWHGCEYIRGKCIIDMFTPQQLSSSHCPREVRKAQLDR